MMVAGLLALSAAGSAQAAVLFSDTFDGEAQGLNQALDNWMIADGTLDVVGPGFFDFHPGNGNYIDLDGSSGNAVTMFTNVGFGGGAYTLSFQLGGSTRGDTNTVTVSLGTFSTTITLDSADPMSTYTYNFTTTAGFLTFAHDGGDFLGLLLDDVVLQDQVAAVPEPASMAIWSVIGMAVVGGRRLRRRLAK
jgi:hypothetical protein